MTTPEGADQIGVQILDIEDLSDEAGGAAVPTTVGTLGCPSSIACIGTIQIPIDSSAS